MSVFYNEFNPESAAMIRQFMTDGLIPSGTVDERSIKEIDPDEIKRYTQCHFFAGIAGWTFALQLAGWPTDRPVWTGSCPCQPFSSAGRQKGKEDDRHLWPVWERLIRECRPASIYGEQVASAITHGWLDDVYQGLEPEGYAIGAAVLPACSVGAPHKRDRLFFVAHTTSAQWETETQKLGILSGMSKNREIFNNLDGRNPPCAMGHAEHDGSPCGSFSGSDGKTIPDHAQGQDRPTKFEGASEPCDVAETDIFYVQGCEDGSQKKQYWGSGEWIDCPDGKKRLVEPSIRLLADGVQHRRPILYAFGNAIVPQVAAKFIEATI